MNRIAPWLLWLALVPPVGAATLEGRVVSVADGDTLTILIDRQQIRVRLAAIDAPEKGQPFANRSRRNLARMVVSMDVVADCHKTDRYGRRVCKVLVQPADCRTCGKTLDVGHAQIIVGLAWWYRAYAHEQSPEDRARYESDENEARLRKRNLWGDDSAVPPWEWRKK